MAKLRKLLLWLGIMVAVLAVAFTAWSAHFAWQLTNATHRPVGPMPKDFPFPMEAVRFPAQDGVPIAGWFVPCPEATRVAVLLHGGRRNRLETVARARLLREHGYAVLLYDARGCGESGGTMLSFGFHEAKDLLGALDYLRGRGFHQFGLLGFSQGGVTIANAADRLRDLCWVVLECTPSDLRLTFDHDMHNAYGVPGWLVGALVIPLVEWRLDVSIKDYTPPRDNVANLHCPLLVIAGGADVRVLPGEARELFDHANKPKWFWLIPGAPHTNYYPAAGKAGGKVYEKALFQFIDFAVKQPRAEGRAADPDPPGN
ncbi:MAG: alpha/beta fold hydrolase [Opitutaceae bacterium]|jgi:pimeloyl-ACP methyl ester carboxylesterase